MIEDFKIWLEELANNANKRKEKIALKTERRPKWSNKEKNKEIKKKFIHEGKRIEGIRPRSSADKQAGEWLYDLVWREFDSEDRLVAVKLAMEIELSDMKKRGLIYDFNKLLQSDSEFKVFVFQQQTKENAQSLINQLKSLSLVYKHKFSSSFLLCCWCWDSGTFMFDDYKTGEQMKS